MRRKAFDGGVVGRLGGWVLPIAFLFLAKPPNRLAAQEPLNAGALFLVFPVGAQAVGMGQTATAAEGRGEAAFWNPAGLATLSDDEFALHSATLVAGRSHVLGAYFPSRGIGVIGGAVYLVDYGDLDRTDPNGNTIARIAPRNFEFLASYATNLAGSFAFGISYKLVQFRVVISPPAPAPRTRSTLAGNSASARAGRCGSASRCGTSVSACKCKTRPRRIRSPRGSRSARNTTCISDHRPAPRSTKPST